MESKMKYLFLVIGVVLTLGAMVNSSLFYLGLVVMGLSFVFTTTSEKSVAKIEERKSLIDRLDKINFNMPDNALSNIVGDVMAVTAKMSKGEKADLSAKNLVAGTVSTINSVTGVLKNK